MNESMAGLSDVSMSDVIKVNNKNNDDSLADYSMASLNDDSMADVSDNNYPVSVNRLAQS